MSSPGRLWTAWAPSSFSSDAPLAERSIAKDLEEEPEGDPENPVDEDSTVETDSDDSTIRPGRPGAPRGSLNVSMVESYRRPSAIRAGSRPTVAAPGPMLSRNLTKTGRQEARREERSLLRDNHIIPPKHPVKKESLPKWIGRQLASVMQSGDRKAAEAEDDEVPGSVRDGHEQGNGVETTPLLRNANVPYGGQDSPANIDKKWEEAVMRGEIQTTWQRESKVIVRYSGPLILTFLLQYSLTVASVFTVGHIGKIELGAVSLASMTANITGYAVYNGLATSLDTLCAQAYGSGRKTLVGLQTQRMVGRLHLAVPQSDKSLIRSYFSGASPFRSAPSG
jgi:multidrug resistance protein, MATE family